MKLGYIISTKRGPKEEQVLILSAKDGDPVVIMYFHDNKNCCWIFLRSN